MRVAYGWQGGDSPNGKRAKVGRREVGRKSCWLLVERSQGERDDWNVLPAALLAELEELGASWQGTEEASLHCWGACFNKRRGKCKRKCLCGRKLEERARTTGTKWKDWLRVPIPAGNTFADVVRLFDAIPLSPVVTWTLQRFGVGVESWQAMGSGTPEQAKAARKRVGSERRQAEQQVERSLDLPSLERLLFGSKWIPSPKGMVKNPNYPDIDSVPTAQYPGDSVPGNWGNEGEFTDSDWFYLLGKNPRIEQTWKAIALLPSDGTTDLYSAALERAVNWVRKVLSDSPTPTSFAVDAAKSQLWYAKRKQPEQVACCQDQLALLLAEQEAEQSRLVVKPFRSVYGTDEGIGRLEYAADTRPTQDWTPETSSIDLWLLPQTIVCTGSILGTESASTEGEFIPLHILTECNSANSSCSSCQRFIR